VENKEDITAKLNEISKGFNEVMKKIELEQEDYWNSLSKEDQIKCFCAVARRIYQGDIVDKGSYRYVLYQIFGFGPESYAQAQMAGYLSIHNAIYDAEHESKVLEAFAKHLGNADPAKAVSSFYEDYL
jgi:hypothetical protein